MCEVALGGAVALFFHGVRSALREGLAPEDGWNRRVEIVGAIPSGAAAAPAIPIPLPVSASGDPAAPLRGVLCS